jgi:anaerobic magnesium-protoporphyrin IX monomethyl ester cyclase
MKILFVQPKGVSFAEGHLWEPVAVGYLISYARKFFPDYKFKVMSAGFYSDKEIIEEGNNSDLVCFTATTAQVYHAEVLAKQIKTRNVFGGVHATSDPEDTFARGADIIVKGEGELAFKKVLESPEDYVGKVVQVPYVDDLDILPFPDRAVIEQEKYLEITKRNDGVKIASITSSRGCPYQCTFCT